MYSTNKNNIIIFTGKSGSGKDASKIYALQNYEVDQVVSSTTRPIRSNEQDGFDYNFVNEDEFKIGMACGDFLEYRKYFTELGVWYYGTPRSAFNDDNSYVLIKDLEGAIKLKSQLELIFNVIIVIISRPDELRKAGAMLRDTNFNEAEWERRLEQDKIDFDWDLVRMNVDFSINNCLDESDLHTDIDNIMNILHINKRSNNVTT